MGVTVEWEGEKRIMMCFSGRWAWLEAQEAAQNAQSMLSTVNCKVKFIIYLENINWMPGDYTANVTQITSNVHPNAGLMIIVTKNSILQQMFYVFNAISGGVSFRYRFTQTLDEARGLLSKIDDE